jgi:hypothetical protein
MPNPISTDNILTESAHGEPTMAVVLLKAG